MSFVAYDVPLDVWSVVIWVGDFNVYLVVISLDTCDIQSNVMLWSSQL